MSMVQNLQNHHHQVPFPPKNEKQISFQNRNCCNGWLFWGKFPLKLFSLCFCLISCGVWRHSPSSTPLLPSTIPCPPPPPPPPPALQLLVRRMHRDRRGPMKMLQIHMDDVCNFISHPPLPLARTQQLLLQRFHTDKVSPVPATTKEQRINRNFFEILISKLSKSFPPQPHSLPCTVPWGIFRSLTSLSSLAVSCNSRSFPLLHHG